MLLGSNGWEGEQIKHQSHAAQSAPLLPGRLIHPGQALQTEG